MTKNVNWDDDVRRLRRLVFRRLINDPSQQNFSIYFSTN